MRRLVFLLFGVGVFFASGQPGNSAATEIASAPAPSGMLVQTASLCDSSGVDQFVDVEPGDYGAEYILCMRALGLSVGTGGGMYGPDSELTREQMAAFLVRLWRDVFSGVCPTGTTPFTDIAGSSHRAAITCLYNLGITKGTSATTYGPRDNLRASQISRFLLRTYEKAGNTCEDQDSVLEEAVTCLQALRVIPSAEEGESTQVVTRSQMGVYMIGLWHNLADRGVPPMPPRLDTGTEQPFEPVDEDSEEPEETLLSVEEVADVIVDLEEFGLVASDSPNTVLVTAIGKTFEIKPFQGEGSLVIPVYMCGPEGKYTPEDVMELTAFLNDELDGFFGRLSSQRFHLSFSEGAIVSGSRPGITSPFPVAQRACRDNALIHSPTPLILVAMDLPYILRLKQKCRGTAFFGGVAMVRTPEWESLKLAYLNTVVHELGHSVLQLHHHRYDSRGGIYIGPDPFDYINPGKYYASLLAQPALGCYQYEQLGWPVPDYAQPCGRFAAREPTSVAISQTGKDALTLTWEPPIFTDGPVVGYTVTIWDPMDGSIRQTYEVDSDARVQIIHGLGALSGDNTIAVTANTKYVRGDDGSTPSSFYIPPRPPLLQPIDVDRVTATRIDLSWKQSSITSTDYNIDYEIEYGTDGAFSPTIAGSNRVSYITGLMPNTIYSIRGRLCGTSASGFATLCGDWNTITVATGSDLPPPDPISVDVGSDWYVLSWDAAPGASNYEVALPDGEQQLLDSPTFSRYFGLGPDTSYTIRIRSCKEDLGGFTCGAWTSITFSTLTQAGAPAPYQVSLEELSDDSASLSWKTPPVQVRYRVEYEYTDGVTTSGILDSSALIGEPLSIPIEPNKTYTFRVRNCQLSEDNPMCSNWAALTFSTSSSSTVGRPSLSVTDVGTRWFTVSWEPITGATTYEWRHQTSGGARSGDTTSTSLETVQAQPGKPYTVDIRACGQLSKPCGEWATVTITTAASLPTAPASHPLSVTDVQDTHFLLSWNPSDPDIYYQVLIYEEEPEREHSAGFTEGASHFGEDWQIHELKPGTAYIVYARTCPWSEDSPCTSWVAFKVTTLGSD